jgi:sugar phosphate isomerase/epimerase
MKLVLNIGVEKRRMTMNQTAGWRLGCQAYSFHHFTFFEAIDKNAALGLKFIEAYPGQLLSPEQKDVKFGHDASPEVLDAVRAKLAACGVAMVNYGVVDLPADEGQSRKVFDFAAKMGIETIVSEPAEEALPLVDALCQEYGIRMAIHNHPAPSRYWNPDTVLAACRGRSQLLGACADTGHWVRSGIEPVEALRKLDGRIVSLHIKDVDRRAPEAEDVPWGTGVGDMEGQLTEIRRQGIAPVFSIEYEMPTADDPQADIAKCVAYFKQFCAERVKGAPA